MVTWIPLEMSMLRRSLRTQALIQELGNLDNEDSNDSQDTQDTPLKSKTNTLDGRTCWNAIVFEQKQSTGIVLL